jgi:hypothetical protein
MTLGQAALATEPSTPPATAPFALSEAQMDQVKAGAAGNANAILSGSGKMRTGGAADPYPTINAGKRGGGYGGQS